ncbi:MAG: leucine-rich repeat domain-containing protein [Methanophagales archaeon]|nr:leucine-rich repeat domain-containing protein [Methanophagales archaeon]
MDLSHNLPDHAQVDIEVIRTEDGRAINVDGAGVELDNMLIGTADGFLINTTGFRTGEYTVTVDTDPRYAYGLDIDSNTVTITVIEDEPEPDQVVIFPDPNLEAAIREALGIPADVNIYRSDLERLTELRASNRGISDLTGLEYAVNLQGLRLGWNQITDISPLSALTELRVLHLDRNQIADITPLSGLTKLGEVEFEWWLREREGVKISLGLRHNEITKISALVANQGLSETDGIDLRGNPLSQDSHEIYLPQLKARGVEVLYDAPAVTPPVFDTDEPSNPYPSIAGTFTGTITPTKTITATKLYTYAIIGTGGHTKYALIYNETWAAEASWDGFVGDWRNISFNRTVLLMPYETYNITLITGSYPQIHHVKALETESGWINTSSFVDVNEKEHDGWIPAIRLWGCVGNRQGL